MSVELSADYVRKSYRYLRLGLIAAAVLLAVSILLEWWAVDFSCWQTSISGYYFTPVRAVFVSALVAIGVSLIAIKGRGVEDLLLNFAGMLAPVVAFVPTRNAGACWSSPPPASPIVTLPGGDEALAGWVVANVDNNLRALIITGLIAIAAAFILLAVLDDRGISAPFRFNEGDQAARRGIAVMLLVIIVVWALYETDWEWFRSQLHNGAAVLMFVFLGAASAVNAHRKSHPGIRGANSDLDDDAVDASFQSSRKYFHWYWLIPTTMLVAVGLIGLIAWQVEDWRHPVLVVEAIEILVFAIYWGVQTAEHWDDPIGTTA